MTAHIKRRYLISIIAALGFIAVVAAAIGYVQSPHYQLKQVLSLYFNGPNDDIIQSFEDAVEESHKALANSGEKISYINLDSLKNKLYGKYFTDKGLESFWVRTEPTRYQSMLDENNCTVKINQVTVEASSSNETYSTYSFKVSLDILNGNHEHENLTISGSAQRQQNGQISYLDFHNINNLIQIL